MKLPNAMPFRVALPLPDFVLHPLTPLVIAAVHVYLAASHLSKLIGGDVQWTHIWKGFGWKGFGALAGARVFAALASRDSPEVKAGTFTEALCDEAKAQVAASSGEQASLAACLYSSLPRRLPDPGGVAFETGCLAVRRPSAIKEHCWLGNRRPGNERQLARRGRRSPEMASPIG